MLNFFSRLAPFSFALCSFKLPEGMQHTLDIFVQGLKGLFHFGGERKSLSF